MREKEPNIEKETKIEEAEEGIIEKEEKESVVEQRTEGLLEVEIEEPKEQELERTRKELEEISKKEERGGIEEGEAEKEKRKLETIKKFTGETIPELFKSLASDDSEKAWEKRKKWEGKEPMYVAASLAGVASKRSREWLNQHKEDKKLWWGISRGLIGDDSEEAWRIRDWLKFDQNVKRIRGEKWTLFKKALGFHKSERIFNLRGKIKFPGWYEPGDIVISTVGLDSEKSQRLREEFERIAPAEVLISLAGNNSEWAWGIREKHKKDKKLRWAYEKSLIGTET